MMDFATTIFSLFSLLLQGFGAWILTQLIFALLKQTRIWNPRRLPPGPFPLPIIGNLHCLGKMPHKSAAEIARRYGDLVSLQLGSLTTILISSPSRAQEVFRDHDAVLAHRQIRQTTTASDQYLHSVIFLPPGHLWRHLRKIGTSNLFSTSRLDAGRDLRRKKVEELLSYVEDCSRTSTAVNISQAAFSTSLNILSNTFFSKDLADLRPGSADDAGHELKGLISDAIALAGVPNISDLFPVFSSIDPQGLLRRSKALKQRILDLFDGIVEERMMHRRRRKQTGGDEEDDVLDVLITIHQEKKDEFRLSDLRFLLFDLFLAGTDTTSSTIEWAMSELLLLRNQDALKKAQAELDQLIGRGNLVEDHHVAKLPYLRAVIKETLRLHPAVPFLIPRKASAAVELKGGFVVPKDAQVWINVWAMDRDESVWNDAESFRPERFLDLVPEIDYRGQNYDLIPFGSGRRVCLGLPFAHRVLHAVLGSLINCFDWKAPQGVGVGVDDTNMDERFGLTLQKARPLCVDPVPVPVGDDKVSIY